MAETNGQHSFGELSRNTAKLEEYEFGSWIRFFEKGNIYQGKLGEVDHKNGEVTFTALTQFMNNEKGQVLAVVEMPEKFMLADIQRHRQSSEAEVAESIENQSPFYSRIGEYVALPCGGITYTGKLHKMFRNHVELLPYVNIKCGEGYIEMEKPVCVPVNGGSTIIPRTKEDLDHIVAEMTRQKNKAESPLQESSIIIAT
jgi:hypothetical protein